MSANADPNWTVNSQTGEGTALSVTDGERDYDVKTAGVGVSDVIDRDTGESVGTLFDA